MPLPDASLRPRKASPLQAPFEIGGHVLAPGTRTRVDLPVARLPTHTPIDLPLVVLHGQRPGARLFLSAAIHGDEINGIEIIRRLLQVLRPKRLRGTIIAAPVVNLFGFIQGIRELPDKRDLNRSFPGSARGSLASRLAHLFVSEVVDRCTHGIDFHTAAGDRINLPQVRVGARDKEARQCAEAFGAPVLLPSGERSGSLRRYARGRGLTYLLYEAGEPLRFNTRSIDIGVKGTLRVLQHLGMYRSRVSKARTPTWAGASRWVRARRGGIVNLRVKPGDLVGAGDVILTISDPFGDRLVSMKSPVDGIVIGLSSNPVVHQGDALVHVAALDQRAVSEAAERAL